MLANGSTLIWQTDIQNMISAAVYRRMESERCSGFDISAIEGKCHLYHMCYYSTSLHMLMQMEKEVLSISYDEPTLGA